MYFDINNYKGKYVMHCKTKEEAISFCDYIRKNGHVDAHQNWWDYYESETAYNFNEGVYCDINYYEKHDYTILEWEDFMKHTFTKAGLKTGDVVTKRNGNVEIVNRNLEMLICRSGFNDLDDLRDDLTSTAGKNFDIVEVRRPTRKNQCTFDGNMGTLVYERKEVEEMTLEQVCKLLGKEIKIIKG